MAVEFQRIFIDFKCSVSRHVNGAFDASTNVVAEVPYDNFFISHYRRYLTFATVSEPDLPLRSAQIRLLKADALALCGCMVEKTAQLSAQRLSPVRKVFRIPSPQALGSEKRSVRLSPNPSTYTIHALAKFIEYDYTLSMNVLHDSYLRHLSSSP
ncbi:hypothetical protein CLF_104297, partial [Clonorchis sinensis]